MPQTGLYVIFVTLIFLVFVNEQVNAQIESPLKQFKQGIPISEIKCLQDQQLVIRKNSDTPACVYLESALKLVQRGWAITVDITENKTASTKTTSPVFAIFYTAGSNHTNLELFERHLRPGDYLFIATPLDHDSDLGQLAQDVSEAKNKTIPGVKVLSFVWYSKIDMIKLHSAYLPQYIDGIIYDYENGTNYSPEYTTEYNKVSPLFET